MVSLTDDPDEDDLEADTGDDAGDEPEPELEEDSYADIDPEIAEKVAAADAEDADGDDGSDDAVDGGNDGDASDDAGDDTPDNLSPGHIYCKALGAGATISQERMGSGVDDRSAAIEDYAELAKDLDLDDYFDQWYAENIGGSDEISPGQGLVAFSSLFAVMVLVEDAEMLDGAIDSMNDLSTETEAA
ncbi:hypothetical protein [Natrinema versiforme]|uniref:Uncharacterized protein n=2 Tax=root TaxID=1 RepID=A0A4P8WNZ8_9EURY|nr:hypothetical protein [Natrinema versiforme]YP_010772683.1 putative viral structural protein [Natrinema versiforme icosahedral virus 1]QCS45105.1 hypothetical protein FEJ81_22815 [Natrinema versiforme]DAC85266.1 TPA_asm: putative viral structural protein [Natrinema versiforme icosahedral virus 1]